MQKYRLYFTENLRPMAVSSSSIENLLDTFDEYSRNNNPKINPDSLIRLCVGEKVITSCKFKDYLTKIYDQNTMLLSLKIPLSTDYAKHHVTSKRGISMVQPYKSTSVFSDHELFDEDYSKPLAVGGDEILEYLKLRMESIEQYGTIHTNALVPNSFFESGTEETPVVSTVVSLDIAKELDKIMELTGSEPSGATMDHIYLIASSLKYAVQNAS